MITQNYSKNTKKCSELIISKICCLIFCIFLSSCHIISHDLDHSLIKIADNNYTIAEDFYVKRKFKDAIHHYKASLKFNKKYRPKVAVRDLIRIGDCYKELRNFDDSERFYFDALKIDQEHYDNNHPNISRDYYLLAKLNFMFGRYSQCKDHIEASLKIDRSISNYSDIIRDLNILALLYDSLGQYDKSISTYKELIALIREVYGEKNENMAKVLSNIAIAYANKNNFKEAIHHSKQSLKIDQFILGNEHIYVARDLNNLGILYKRINNYSEAKSNYLLSLKIYEKNYGRDHPIVAAILCNMGIIYSKEKNYSESLDYLQRALIIAEKSKEPELLWRVLNTLREFYIIQDDPKKYDPNKSIFWGKRAVSIIQNQRILISDLDKTLQKSFMTNKKSVYRELARTMFQQGRYLEGFQVWQMLKDEELFEFIDDSNSRGANNNINMTTRTSDFYDMTKKEEIDQTIHEKNEYKEYQKLKEDIILQEKEYNRFCNKIADKNSLRCKKIRENTVFVRKKFQDFLSKKKDIQQNSLNSNKITTLYSTLLEKFNSLKDGYRAVIVIYLYYNKEIDILLLMPDIPIYTTTNISSINIEKQIQDYLKEITDFKSNNHLKTAKKLYSYLFKPIEKYLNQYNANMVMFSLDGPLQNIPLAALYDGNHYVAEKYYLSLYDPDIHYQFDRNNKPIHLRASAFGVSKRITITIVNKKRESLKETFKALPAVKAELNAISQYVEVTPCSYLDEHFTKNKFAEELKKSKKNEIFHIASHFKLSNNLASSFLLLGDGNTLSIDEIQSEYKFNDIKLLTLSACNTGTYTAYNNGKYECFGKFTLNRGCQSTLVTLWKVEDQGTALFMQYFYYFLTNGTPFYKSTTKAKALHKAQQYFIAGKKNNFGISFPDERYKHPYYWAPFILMGNWL